MKALPQLMMKNLSQKRIKEEVIFVDYDCIPTVDEDFTPTYSRFLFCFNDK